MSRTSEDESDNEMVDVMIDSPLNREDIETGVDSDGEDPVARKEYEIEVAIVDYHEDPEVRHNSYPEEGDNDREVEDSRERDWSAGRGDGLLFKGQNFYNGIALKEAVLTYALKNQRNIRQRRYEPNKIAFICLGKGKLGNACGWRVYCSVRGSNGKWKIRIYQEKHSCQKSGKCTMLKVTAIARLFLDKIRADPEGVMPATMEGKIFEDYGISVTRNQVQAARCKALKWIEKEYDDQFKRLRDYGNEILDSNPDSTVEVQCLRNSDGEDVFFRFYVCFAALKRSWKANCRPLLGIDGSFLKSKVKGQLLVALGRDADNRIYPVAWGVVAVENTDNWVWFMKMLKKDLGLGEGEGHIIVSDRQKGLIKAVEKELPKIEHRHCVRHIYGNLKATHGKKGIMKPFIWKLAWSYTEAEFDERLEELKNFDYEVYADVMSRDPRSWCRAFYKLGPHCEDVENNSTESFNKSVVKAREMPFVPMLETIRRLAMVRIARRNEESEKHQAIITPYAAEILALEEKSAKECTVKPSTNKQYDVLLHGCGYRVSLESKSCTCRKFQIRGIPCEHAYAIILVRKLFVEEFVSGWFHTEIWKKTYEEGIVPLRGAKFWPRGSLPIIPPQGTVKKPTKEDGKRKRGKNESPTKKAPKVQKREIRCGECHQVGHNSRYHKKEKNAKDTQSDKSKGTGKVNGKGIGKGGGRARGKKKAQEESQSQSSQVLNDPE